MFKVNLPFQTALVPHPYRCSGKSLGMIAAAEGREGNPGSTLQLTIIVTELPKLSRVCVVVHFGIYVCVVIEPAPSTNEITDRNYITNNEQKGFLAIQCG